MVGKIRVLLLLVLANIAGCEKTETVDAREVNGSSAGSDLNLVVSVSESVGQNETTEASWESVAGAIAYQLIVAKDESCSLESQLFSLTVEKTYQSFSVSNSGTFYVCLSATLSNGDVIWADNNGKQLNVKSSDSSSGNASSNEPPTISLSQPDGVGDTIAATGGSFTIVYALADSDDAANASLYYKAASAVGCSDGTLTGWTEFATNLQEADTNYVWNSGLPAAGASYYVCAKAQDSSNDPVFAVSSGMITISVAPTISLTAPAGNDDSVAIASSFDATWADADADNDATVKLYIKATNSGPCATGGTLLLTVSEDDATDSYSWDSTGTDDGFYYFCANIDDGVNTPVEAYSDRLVVHPSTSCAWVGDTDNDWATNTNWMNCSGGVPDDGADRAIILQAASNQPTVGADTTIWGFDEGSGGGTVTIADGFRLTLNDSATTNAYVRSDVILQGSTNATTAEVAFNRNLLVEKGATLTFKADLIRYGQYNHYMFIGSSTEQGHLRIENDGIASSRWFRNATSTGHGQSGFVIEGPSASEKSSAYIDGAKITNITYSQVGLRFLNHYEIKKLDNMVLGGGTGYPNFGSDLIRIEQCANGTFTDTAWSNIMFDDSLHNQNVDAGTSCTTVGGGTISVTGSGSMYTSALENDPNNLINWTGEASTTAFTCTFTGATDNDWHTAGNWSSCNDRGGWPDYYDSVIIPTGLNVEISTTASIQQIASGSGGGTITLMDDFIYLTLYDTTNSIQSDVKVECANDKTNCGLSSHTTMVVNNNATLTLGQEMGLRVVQPYSTVASLRVGDGSSAGHLATETGLASTKWPIFAKISSTSNYAHNYMRVEGTSSQQSTLNLDGMIFSVARNEDKVQLIDYYTFTKFDNIEFDGSFAGVDMMNFSDCSNAVFTDTTWSGMTFTGTPAYNINLGGTNCNSITNITVDGSGTAYGSGSENDPGSVLSWL